MLDINRLSVNPLLIKSGWTPAHKIDIDKYYLQISNSKYAPQVPVN